MGNNANCAQFMSQSEEMNNLKVAACAANCLKVDTNVVSLRFPYKTENFI